MKISWTIMISAIAGVAIGCSSSDSDTTGTTAPTGSDTTGADVMADVASSDGSDESDGMTSTDSATSTDETDGADGVDGSDGATGSVTGADVIIAPPDTSTGGTDTVAVVANTCREAILCRLRCDNDTACAETCTVGASQAIADSIASLDGCVAEKCPGDQPTQCWLDSEICFAEFHGCFYDGKTGAKDCEETYECYADCVSDVQTAFEDFDQTPANPECEDGCLQDATLEAQQDLVTWAFCIVEFCSDQPDLQNCQKTAENNVCGSAANQCTNFQ